MSDKGKSLLAVQKPNSSAPSSSARDTHGIKADLRSSALRYASRCSASPETSLIRHLPHVPLLQEAAGLSPKRVEDDPTGSVPPGTAVRSTIA